jgi:hypothetical protein
MAIACFRLVTFLPEPRGNGRSRRSVYCCLCESWRAAPASAPRELLQAHAVAHVPECSAAPVARARGPIFDFDLPPPDDWRRRSQQSPAG